MWFWILRVMCDLLVKNWRCWAWLFGGLGAFVYGLCVFARWRGLYIAVTFGFDFVVVVRWIWCKFWLLVVLVLGVVKRLDSVVFRHWCLCLLWLTLRFVFVFCVFIVG